MKKKRFSVEQIVGVLKQAQVGIVRGHFTENWDEQVLRNRRDYCP
jgi:hypothetical protein